MKLYNGRIAHGIGVEEWQSRLAAAAKKFRVGARTLHYKRVFADAVEIADMIRCGVGRVTSESPLTEANARYMQFLSRVQAGRYEFYDTSYGVSWIWKHGSIYAVVDPLRRVLSREIENFLGLEDWHYQDQTDRDINISDGDWDLRASTWSDVLDNFQTSPSEVMSRFEVAPAPTPLVWSPPHIPKDIMNPVVIPQAYDQRCAWVSHRSGLSVMSIEGVLPLAPGMSYVDPTYEEG